MERETVGKISLDLMKNSSHDTHSAHEQMVEQLSEFDTDLWLCVDAHKKVWPSQNFYIVAITKRERLMSNVIRNFFLGRLSCPTPDYDQAVYFYNCGNDDLEFLWVIPSRQACFYFISHPLEIAPEESHLLRYVLNFADGSLFKMAQKRNNEV